MHIRPITSTDIPAVMDIGSEAFRNDVLFTWLFPNGAQNPNDLRRYNLQRIRSRLVQVGLHGLVAEADEKDDKWCGKSELVGYAFWLRAGDSSEAMKWQTDSLCAKLERVLLTVEGWYETHVLNRITDWERLRKLNNQSVNNFGSIPDYWELAVLAVSPKFQRRGVGAALMAWGLNVASEEEIPVVLEASKAGTGLYAKMGFKVVGRNKIVDELEVVAMIREPGSV